MFTYIIIARLIGTNIVIGTESLELDTSSKETIQEFVAGFVPAFKANGPNAASIMTDEEITKLGKDIGEKILAQKDFKFEVLNIEVEFKSKV